MVSLQLSLEKRDYAEKLFGNYNYHSFIKFPLANVLLAATAIAQWRQPADNRFDYYRLFLICVTRPPALLPPQMTISHDNRFYPGFCLSAILSSLAHKNHLSTYLWLAPPPKLDLGLNPHPHPIQQQK